MRISRLRMAAGILSCTMALGLAGCGTAQQQPSAEDKAAADAARAANEARGVAEASLGKQAEILSQGDLALNGRKQMLVANRISTGAQPSKGDGNPSPILVTRAAVLEKNDGKWSQILLCDEHLKNPNGYLGGSIDARATGWRLEYVQDAKDGLEMKFTPAPQIEAGYKNSDGYQQPLPTFNVRWNKDTKRYQSFDASHDKYLSERPLLYLPESTLK